MDAYEFVSASQSMIKEVTQHYARRRASTACLMSSSKVGFLPELGKFVLRSQVLSLYRKFFRTARTLPPQQKGKELAVGSSAQPVHN